MRPKQLRECGICGEIRGVTSQGVSSCLCEGTTCRYCDIGRIRRPISDHYSLRDGAFWHTPYFGSMIPCRPCVRLAETSPAHDHGLPGALTADARIRRRLRVIHETVAALRHTTHLLGRNSSLDRSATGILAVTGSSGTWRELGFGGAPDDRPLYLGLADEGGELGEIADNGRTERSALRRALVARLREAQGLRLRPSGTTFGLHPFDDQHLTRWVSAFLRVAVAPVPHGCDGHELLADLTQRWQPPLTLGLGFESPMAPDLRQALAELEIEAWDA